MPQSFITGLTLKTSSPKLITVHFNDRFMYYWTSPDRTNDNSISYQMVQPLLRAKMGWKAGWQKLWLLSKMADYTSGQCLLASLESPMDLPKWDASPYEMKSIYIIAKAFSVPDSITGQKNLWLRFNIVIYTAMVMKLYHMGTGDCNPSKTCVCILECTWEKVNVNCTLVQALRLCTGCIAHMGSTGIASSTLSWPWH